MSVGARVSARTSGTISGFSRSFSSSSNSRLEELDDLCGAKTSTMPKMTEPAIPQVNRPVKARNRRR